MIDYPAINPDDYVLPSDATEEDLFLWLADPVWRICNLYSIWDKNGNLIPFRPNWAQCVVLYHVFVLGRKRIAIPKARQLGFSTLIEIMMADHAYWNEGQQCCIVDLTNEDATDKLDICRTAYHELDPDLKHGASLTVDNNKEIAWASSTITAGKNARGGTNQFLHISEWGPIAYEDPRRSEEIVSGAIPTATGRLTIAESTYKGGKGGDWYEVLQQGVTVSDADRTDLDWTVLFFPWYLDPTSVTYGNVDQIDEETTQYLDACEKRLGRKFAPEQRLFYYKTKQEQGRWMKREYPTFMEEMWQVVEEGQIYAAQVDRARNEGRITDDVLWHQSLPVYTVFDIGAARNTICWIFQAVGDRINLLECIQGHEELHTPADWTAELRKRRYSYGGHFLPHDGEVVWKKLFHQAGLTGVVVLKKRIDVWENIVEAQSNFSRCYFHATACDHGLTALEAYHCKEERDGVSIKEVPVHDWSSHPSTAFGYLHQAIADGLLIDRTAIPEKQGPVKKPKAVGLPKKR